MVQDRARSLTVEKLPGRNNGSYERLDANSFSPSTSIWDSVLIPDQIWKLVLVSEAVKHERVR